MKSLRKLILIVAAITMCTNVFAQKNGMYSSTYDNGQTEEIGEFKNDERIGIWKAYFENGQLNKIGEYKNDERTGEWKIYYQNGNLNYLFNYDNNGLVVKEETYYENGQLREIGEYKDDYETGIWKTYHENGNLASERNYDTKIWKSYYDTGELSAIYDHNYPKFAGLITLYHKNGKIKLKQELVDDYMIRSTYYDNGQIESMYNIKANSEKINSKKVFSSKSTSSRIGIGKEYYENGQLKSIENYENGKLHGEKKWYFPDGQIKEIENYKNGLMSGEFKIYYNNGKINAEGNYANGARIDESTWYKENGEVSSLMKFYGVNPNVSNFDNIDVLEIYSFTRNNTRHARVKLKFSEIGNGSKLYPPGSSLAFYLIDDKGRKYNLTGQDGWKGSGDNGFGRIRATNNLSLILIFEDVPFEDIKTLNLIEGDATNKNNWHFYNILSLDK